MSKNKKFSPIILIPIFVAIFVLIVLAVSGHLTRTEDIKEPTAETSVSAVNEQSSEPVSENSDGKVTLCAVGDNLIHNTLIDAGKQEDGSYDYTSLYQNIAPVIQKYDVSVIDQETVLGGSDFEYSGYPVFNSPQEIGDAAINAGFDIFNCANNHIMDKGSQGIMNEIEYFKKHKNVVYLGINEDEKSYNTIKYYVKNNITFALLNYTYGTNGIDLPSDKPWIVNMMDKDKVTKDIKEARANADVVIVFPHWGTENSFSISDYQKEYTDLFSKLGVDLVIGCHPHVIEPVKEVTNESGHKMLVYYSLGNFISHQIEIDQLCGGIASVDIEKKNGKITVNGKFIPIVTHYNRTDGDKFRFDVYKLSDYTDELAKSHSQNGGTPEYYNKLVKKVIDEKYLDLS